MCLLSLFFSYFLFITYCKRLDFMIWLNVIFPWVLGLGSFSCSDLLIIFINFGKALAIISSNTCSVLLPLLSFKDFSYVHIGMLEILPQLIHFLLVKKNLCFFVDRFYLIAMSSSSLIFFTAMSGLLLISSTIFLNSDFVVLSLYVQWVSFLSLRCYNMLQLSFTWLT